MDRGRIMRPSITSRKKYQGFDKKNGAKKKAIQHLQYLITNFAIEICPKVDKEKFNKAWHKLWCRINRIGLFK